LTRPACERKVNRKDAPMLGKYTLAAAAASKGFNPSTLILILIVVVAFYFLMIRPQQRRKQQAAQKQNTVAPGATVRTTAGMYATVVEVDGDDVILEVAPGVEVRYMKRAIMDVVSSGEEPAEDLYETDDETVEGETADDDIAEDGIADEEIADDETVVDETPKPSDAEETAYEKATGSKKD
jgi:preprotein translocase subunit YajC